MKPKEGSKIQPPLVKMKRKIQTIIDFHFRFTLIVFSRETFNTVSNIIEIYRLKI